MIPGDRVRLAHPHPAQSLGAEGIVAALSRRDGQDFVTVHFEAQDEVVPEAWLAVVHVRARPWARLDPGQIFRSTNAHGVDDRSRTGPPVSKQPQGRYVLTVVNAHAPTPSPVRFNLEDAVRLLDHHGEVPSGSVGRVLGTFPRSYGTTYIVSFVDEKVCVLELRRNEIDLVSDFHDA